MRHLITTLLAALLTSLALSASAATAPYDEVADAKAEIRAAQAQAQQANMPLIVVFGANWCGDCKMLDEAFKSGAVAPLMQKNFKVVKVNVGKFDRNTDIAESLGVPLKKGIPAVAILSADGKPMYVTRSGELASARSMGDAGVFEFFKKVTSTTPQ